MGWTANVGSYTDYDINNTVIATGCNSFQPDFQGGFTVMTHGFHGQNQPQTQPTIQKFDGMTGHLDPAVLQVRLD